ncbi:MAG TPA: hypothetical protein VHC19_17995 [Pirellulales bacterium]|nr:hypothetical protein [Pirellulales bacterium]
MPQPCPLHQVPHCDGFAIRLSGLIDGLFDYVSVLPTRFPHANAVNFLSCADRQRGGRKKVRYCQKCRKELLDWCKAKLEEHGDSPNFVMAVQWHLSGAEEQFRAEKANQWTMTCRIRFRRNWMRKSAH